MRSMEKAARLAFGSIILIGGLAACGSKADKPLTDEDYRKDVARLSEELRPLETALAAGQAAYNGAFAHLPHDCAAAITPYIDGIPGSGSLDDVKTKPATQYTAQWCGPDNLGAIADFRRDYKTLLDTQDAVNGHKWWIGADLAAVLHVAPLRQG
jgi:hypothetical protein